MEISLLFALEVFKLLFRGIFLLLIVERKAGFLRASAMVTLIHPIVETIPEPSTKAVIPTIMRAQSSHPLDPLSAAEISVAVATVRAAGSTPEVRDSMRFIEVVLSEPEKHVVALADAYFFSPFQPSLLPRTKGVTGFPGKLPPRCARLIVYNRKSNKTSIWIVELSEVHAATRGGHHRGKVISSQVVPDVQPPMDAVEYAECEAVVKDFPPFREAMKKRGIEDLDLVMVDPWCAGYHSNLWKTSTYERVPKRSLLRMTSVPSSTQQSEYVPLPDDMNVDDAQVPLAGVDYLWDGEAIPSYDAPISPVREPTPGSTSRSRTPAPQVGESSTSASNDDPNTEVVKVLKDMVSSYEIDNALFFKRLKFLGRKDEHSYKLMFLALEPEQRVSFLEAILS
ncbi:hypothetical protein GIB67_015492 [Kingdonia uniflora]|uniref:Amine oxidase n=1 Tax=Kingdonia uniflora TaxID=39325 RepID=A0A7J7LA75_9MAGN|nr:hypothetical protein GIB67_015492 [Kingdonia uniflora]